MDEATFRAALSSVRRGASLQAACGSLGLEVEDFLEAAVEDGAALSHLRLSKGLLSGNVLARVYAAAMEGSVPAMSLYLKHAPPADEAVEPGDPQDDLDRRRRDELEADLRRVDGELRRIAEGRPPGEAAAE